MQPMTPAQIRRQGRILLACGVFVLVISVLTYLLTRTTQVLVSMLPAAAMFLIMGGVQLARARRGEQQLR